MFDDLVLTPAETRLVEATDVGGKIDFGKAGDSATDGAAWGPERTLRSNVLVALLTNEARDNRPPLRALHATGARISGQLDLEALTLLRPLALQDCYFEQEVLLNEARALRLDFAGSRVPTFCARQLHTRGNLTLDRVVVATNVDLAGAQIGGMLRLCAAQVENPGAVILDGERLEVHVGMDCRALRTDGELHLAGAHIGGRLIFSGANLRNVQGTALNAENLQVDSDLLCQSMGNRRFEAEGELRLTGAHIGGDFTLAGGRLRNLGRGALIADGFRVDGVMSCGVAYGQRFEAEGELRLLGARIGGQLQFLGARLFNPNGPALSADRLNVGIDMVCQTDGQGQRFEADGQVRLVGAHIAGELSFIGARLCNPGGYALDAERLETDHSMHCHTDWRGQRFEAYGRVSLFGACIGSELNFVGARLDNPEGLALNAEALRVTLDMLCRSEIDGPPFDARGALRLLGTQIAGHLDLTGAQLASSTPVALDFKQGHARRLSLPRSVAPHQVVDLTNAEVSVLHDHPASRGQPCYRARVSGFTYDAIGQEAYECSERLTWLEGASDGFVPQAYDHLAAVFRGAGREQDAKKVLIAKHKRHRSTLHPLGKLIDLLFKAPMGYGYRTWRAVAALFVIVCIGWAVFAYAHPDHMTATRPAAQLPDFTALVYSLDAVLPVVNLGQESARAPTGWWQAWYAFSVLAGWLLSLGLVAFVTARFFRE